jgi:small-conductance mechanosensitive channel
MDQPWWAHVLQWTLWGIAMAFVMGWVAKSRHRSRPESEARRLVHPPSTLIIGLVSLAFFSAIAAIATFCADKTTALPVTALFLGFAALALVIIAEYFRAWHEVSDEGMNYGRLTGKRGSLKWSEVVRVRYVLGMNWFKLETQSGAVARVSAMLMGLPEFARLVLTHVSPAAIDPKTAPVLEATAAGDPPKVWY